MVIVVVPSSNASVSGTTLATRWESNEDTTPNLPVVDQTPFYLHLLVPNGAVGGQTIVRVVPLDGRGPYFQILVPVGATPGQQLLVTPPQAWSYERPSPLEIIQATARLDRL